MDLKILHVPQRYSQLGRQLVHDPRSRGFPAQVTVDKSTWHTRTIRVTDPTPHPNQCHSECTGAAKAMEFNAAGNRIKGEVLNMDFAHWFYHNATLVDPFPGEWPPRDDGSSGLAAAQVAKTLGIGGEYRHIFGGADEIVQLIMAGRVVNVGTWWYDDMFQPDAKGIIEPTGPRVGGHQYLAQGYYKPLDLVVIRCWWGQFKDVYIKREHLNQLVLDDGDAHIQDRLKWVPTHADDPRLR